MNHAALVSILCVAFAGCGGGGVQNQALPSPDSGSLKAESNVRAAVPSLEAYYAQNGTYAGVSLEKLRKLFGTGLVDIRFVVADVRTYCIESTVNGHTWSKRGPAADITAGAC